MALIKSKTLINGASGDYWKINQLHFTTTPLKVSYIISLYVDDDHADIGASLGLNKTYTFSITHTESLGDLRALGYDKIKTKAATMVLPLGGIPGDDLVEFDPDLSGATDS